MGTTLGGARPESRHHAVTFQHVKQSFTGPELKQASVALMAIFGMVSVKTIHFHRET